jgi:catechol 2,3-dioxygenase-like lactoylglutathione lyase family enzyme
MTTTLSQTERNKADGSGRLPVGGFNPLVPELDVVEINRSVHFWCDLLGFSVAYDRPAANFVYLEREGTQIMLCQINGWVTGELDRPFGRGVNFQIEVQDIEPILSALEGVNWPLFKMVKESWYRVGEDAECGAKKFLVQDPDGHLK